MKEFKSFPILSKSIVGRTVTGICSVFGNVDEGGDRIHFGAFSKTLMEAGRNAKHLWNHDWYSPPIAIIKELREVTREELPAEVLSVAPEATGGLLVSREYLDTGRADEVFAGIQAGAINQMSFGYDVIKADWSRDQEQNVREIKEVRLWETSDVLWGMNSATVASKSLLQLQVESLCQYLAQCKRGSLGSDELQLIEENLAKALAALKPDDERQAEPSPLARAEAELLEVEAYLL